MLGLHCCSGFSLAAASRGYSLVAACGLIAAASLVEHGLWEHGLWELQLAGPGAQAQELWWYWLTRSGACGIFLDRGLKPVSSAWADSLLLSHQRSPDFLLLAQNQNKQIYPTGNSGFYDPNLGGAEHHSESPVSVCTHFPNADGRRGRAQLFPTCLPSSGVLGRRVTESPRTRRSKINLQAHLLPRPLCGLLWFQFRHRARAAASCFSKSNVWFLCFFL